MGDKKLVFLYTLSDKDRNEKNVINLTISPLIFKIQPKILNKQILVDNFDTSKELCSVANIQCRSNVKTKFEQRRERIYRLITWIVIC